MEILKRVFTKLQENENPSGEKAENAVNINIPQRKSRKLIILENFEWSVKQMWLTSKERKLCASHCGFFLYSYLNLIKQKRGCRKIKKEKVPVRKKGMVWKGLRHFGKMSINLFGEFFSWKEGFDNFSLPMQVFCCLLHLV